MKKLLKIGLAAFAFALAAGSVQAAETIQKLHSSAQRVLSTSITSTAYSTSSVVSLSGGDLDKASFMLWITSSTTTNGSPTLDVDIQVSPDGGTSWGRCATFTQITSTSTAATPVTAFKQDVAVAPGNQLRVILRSSSNTQWYNLKFWVLPSVN